MTRRGGPATVEWRVRAVRAVYGMASEQASGRVVRAVESQVHVDERGQPADERRQMSTRRRPSRIASPCPAVPVTTTLSPASCSPATGRRTRVCTGCTASATATASTSSTAARSSAVPRTHRGRAGRSIFRRSPEDLAKARGKILKDGKEGGTFTADTAPVTTTETVAEGSGLDAGGAAASSDGGKGSSSPGATSAVHGSEAGQGRPLGSRREQGSAVTTSTVVPVQVASPRTGKSSTTRRSSRRTHAKGRSRRTGLRHRRRASLRSGSRAPTRSRCRRRSGCRRPDVS